MNSAMLELQQLKSIFQRSPIGMTQVEQAISRNRETIVMLSKQKQRKQLQQQQQLQQQLQQPTLPLNLSETSQHFPNISPPHGVSML